MSNSKKVTKEDVLQIAQLCQLNLTDEEVAKFSEIFTDTLEYIDVMDELDLSTTKETFQVTGLSNVYQDYSVSTTLSQEEALKNANKVIKNMFATKAVFDR